MKKQLCHAYVINKICYKLTIALREATENIPTLPRATLVGLETDAKRDCTENNYIIFMTVMNLLYCVQTHLRIRQLMSFQRSNVTTNPTVVINEYYHVYDKQQAYAV